MSTALESARRLNALKQSIEAKTGKTYTDLTEGVQALTDGYGTGGESSGGASDIYLAKITPEEDLNDFTIIHNLGTIDILSVSIWAETLGDFVPDVVYTLHKVWNKTDISTKRGGNGFSVGYSWSTTNQCADTNSPNVASYETLTVVDENTIKMPRTQSGTSNKYMAGLTYTVIVVAASAGEV